MKALPLTDFHPQCSLFLLTRLPDLQWRPPLHHHLESPRAASCLRPCRLRAAGTEPPLSRPPSAASSGALSPLVSCCITLPARGSLLQSQTAHQPPSRCMTSPHNRYSAARATQTDALLRLCLLVTNVVK